MTSKFNPRTESEVEATLGPELLEEQALQELTAREVPPLAKAVLSQESLRALPHALKRSSRTKDQGKDQEQDKVVEVSLSERQKLLDLLALRLVLMGESVLDVANLWFSERREVDVFLRLNGFDTDNPLDLEHLHELQHEAVSYLTELHGYTVPPAFSESAEIHDLFLIASNAAGVDVTPEVRKFACLTLKVMHILHHLAARELVFNTPISEADLFARLQRHVFTIIDKMRSSGIEFLEYAAGQKSLTSLITKLLVKRSHLASHIFDKVRLRIVVKTKEDLVRALLYLIHNLCPFNFIIPEQSQNRIITLEDISAVLGSPVKEIAHYWQHYVAGKYVNNPNHPEPVVPAGTAAAKKRLEASLLSEAESALPLALERANQFSGSTYKSVNFVADIPLRIDDVVSGKKTPAIVFVQTEIQLIDAATEKANEEGENAHARYKERQLANVRKRLEG